MNSNYVAEIQSTCIPNEQHVSGDMCPSTYMYPVTSCSFGIHVSGRHVVSWCKRGIMSPHAQVLQCRSWKVICDGPSRLLISEFRVAGEIGRPTDRDRQPIQFYFRLFIQYTHGWYAWIQFMQLNNPHHSYHCVKYSIIFHNPASFWAHAYSFWLTFGSGYYSFPEEMSFPWKWVFSEVAFIVSASHLPYSTANSLQPLPSNVVFGSQFDCRWFPLHL